MHFTRVLIRLVSGALLLFGVTSAFADPLFNIGNSYAVGDQAMDVEALDFDCDSDLDLAVAVAGSDCLRLLHNNGNGTFSVGTCVSVGDYPVSVFGADLDNDGDYDLAVINSYSDNMMILLNGGGVGGCGGGNFVVTQTLEDICEDKPQAGLSPVNGADVDGDGDCDLVVAMHSMASFRVFLNNGDGSFTRGYSNGVLDGPIGVYINDLNGDDTLDLAFGIQRNSGYLSIVWGIGDGTFTAPSVNYAARWEVMGIAGGDIDNDGDCDLITSSLPHSVISAFYNNGTGVFSRADYPAGYTNFGIVCEDFDLDGDLDVVTTARYEDSLAIMLNNGNGTFAPPVCMPTHGQPLRLCALDFDQDGDLDLAVAHQSSDDVVLFRNNTDPFLLEVSSSPELGISITVAPDHCPGGTITPFSCTYTNGTEVTLTAPAATGEYVFQKWTKGGEDWGTSTTSPTLAMDADYSVTAVYVDNCTGTVTDIDGNIYQTVTIGTQEWMAENLEVTHYRNGDAIPNVTGSIAWLGLSAGAYCEYLNDIGYVPAYGRIYNWFAVADSRSIAPAGWHVPTEAEWHTLVNYLGGYELAGGKLKEAGTIHWASPNIGATNESGFTALPGGHRDYNGNFYDIGYNTDFWSSTELNSLSAFKRTLTHSSTSISGGDNDKRTGFYIRCIKDAGPCSYDLSIASSPITGVLISVAPEDCPSGTTTPFSCSYVNGSQVTLTAPATTGEYVFEKWTKDGEDWGLSTTSPTLTMDADYSVTAVYVTQALCFEAAVNYAAGHGSVSVFAADLDGDGDQDLATANVGGDNVSILMNDGDGTFAPPINYAAGSNAWSVFAADLDGDGDQDLVAANQNGNSVSVLRNNGNGTYASAVNYATGSEPRSVFASDLDGDGDQDLAVANFGSGNVSILKNNGDGTFVSAVNYATGSGSYPRGVFASDLDSDGDQDLAVTNGNAHSISVLKNNGGGAFSAAVIYDTSPGYNPWSIFAADLDRDGDNDLAVTNDGSQDVSILKNNGDGTFASATYYPVGMSPRAIFVADLNGDGDQDVAVANSGSGNVSVLKNNGDGTFAIAVNYATGSQPWGVFAADLDRDGDQDLAVGKFGSDSVSVLKNCLVDTDGDGLADDFDNCPTVHNPGQWDTDADGIGDSCDACTDTDGDSYGLPGFPASTCQVDNCPGTSNNDQIDTDGNGLGDVCSNSDQYGLIEIIPANPTESDTIIIRISGTYGNTCFHPGVPTGWGNGHPFNYAMTTEKYGPGCFQILVGFGIVDTVGLLQPGVYGVQWLEYVHQFEDGQVWTRFASKTFTVSASQRTLNVASSPASGVLITVLPDNCPGGTTTPFSCTYTNGTDVTLTAPATVGGNAFQKWQKDGVDWGFSTTSPTLTMDANYSVTAVYSSDCGNQLAFDGDDVVAIPHNPLLSFSQTSTFTIEFWYRLESAQEIYHLLSKRTFCGPGPGWNYQIARDEETHLAFSAYGPDNQVTLGDPPVGEWTHVAVTYDGSRLVGYLNGTQTVEMSPYTVYGENTAPVTIGAGAVDCPYDLHGQMDEVRIWSIARTPGEILSWFNKKVAPSDPSLLAYWSFDEESGQQVNDLTPNALNGTLGETSSVEASDPIRESTNAPLTGCAGTQQHTLSVASSPASGVSITVSPDNCPGGTTTPFSCTYTNGTDVTLTAPATAGGIAFQKWQKDGEDWGFSATSPVLTIDADYSVTAVYAVYVNGNWSPLAEGTDANIEALTVYEGELIATGNFMTAGTVPNINRVAAWNGTSWRRLGNALINYGTSALSVYEGDLYVGGHFNFTANGQLTHGIAGWDGANWFHVGGGINDGVRGLRLFNNELVAGGDFTVAGNVAVNYVAKWNGSSYSRLGSGFADGDTWGAYAEAFTIYNGQLIAGGIFRTAGGHTVNHIAAWNGTSWSALGEGMNATVSALCVYDGKLIAGGGFTTAGVVSAQHLAVWDGTSWAEFGGGADAHVAALGIYNGQLVAGGHFTSVGGVSASKIAAWNAAGSTWVPLGSGMNGIVTDVTVYQNRLIAAGNFTTAGGVAANNIAQWDGSLPWLTVTSQTPTPNALNVSPSSQVTATFNLDMNPATINTGSFIVTGNTAGSIQGVVTYDNGTRTATFTPSGPLPAGEHVTALLTTGMQTTTGLSLNQSYSWSFTTAAVATTGYFGAAMGVSSGTDHVALDVADFNGDGYPDIVQMGSTSNISVMLNNTTGTDATSGFDQYVLYPVTEGLYSVSVATGDFDGDHDVDIAVLRNDDYDNHISIMRNNGNGTFSVQPAISVGNGPGRALCSADFNGDGRADLAVGLRSHDLLPYPHNHGEFIILLGNANGTFQGSGSCEVHNWSDITQVQAADLNQDGHVDVVAQWGGAVEVAVFLNNGSGSMAFDSDVANSQAKGSNHLAIADLDGDSYLDIVTAFNGCRYTCPDVMSFFKNTGAGRFVLTHVDGAGFYWNSMDCGDIDGDGDNDLVVIEGGTWWSPGGWVDSYRNFGGFDFRNLGGNVGMNNNPCYGTLVDLDNDGDLDLVVGACMAGSSLYVSKNRDCYDSDGDGYGDPGHPENACMTDNCPTVYNPDQNPSACTFTAATAAGQNSETDLGAVTIGFANVTTGGTTELIIGGIGPTTGPDGFDVVPWSVPTYYNVSTSASYQGSIQLCIGYEDSIYTTEQESFLKLLHYDGASWLNITTTVDTDANTVCGVTSSLSPFALAVPNSFTCGDASGDAAVDISDAVSLIAYIFSGGPAPSPLEAGDANCDGMVDISDAVYLIAYIFSGGLAPCALCE